MSIDEMIEEIRDLERKIEEYDPWTSEDGPGEDTQGFWQGQLESLKEDLSHAMNDAGDPI